MVVSIGHRNSWLLLIDQEGERDEIGGTRAAVERG
jgi:hypothetical protein